MRISVPDDEYSLAMCSWVDLHVFVLCNDPSPLTEQAQRSASRYELMNIADWSATCSTPEGTGNVIAGEKSFRGHERSSMSTGACDCTHLFLPCARALEYQFMRSWNSISPQSPQLNLKSRKRKNDGSPFPRRKTRLGRREGASCLAQTPGPWVRLPGPAQVPTSLSSSLRAPFPPSVADGVAFVALAVFTDVYGVFYKGWFCLDSSLFFLHVSRVPHLHSNPLPIPAFQ